MNIAICVEKNKLQQVQVIGGEVEISRTKLHHISSPSVRTILDIYEAKCFLVEHLYVCDGYTER